VADEDDFAALFEASMVGGKKRAKLEPGKLAQGVVVAIDEDTVFVDVGMRTEGRLPRAEVLDKTGKLTIAVGDTVRAMVVSARQGDAPVLSVAFGRGEAGAAELDAALQSGVAIEGEVARAVKAGLEVTIAGKRAFCPASQVDLGYVKDLEQFVGQRHFFKVIEIRDGGRSIVVSRRAVLQDEREKQAEALVARLEPGMELDGIVQSLAAYGAFIELGGMQGLLHVSEISHSRVSSPADVLSVGEKVRVQVLSIEKQADPKKAPRISLSMKSLVQPSAAADAEEREVVSGKVSKVDNYGVIVDTPGGSGLVPVAELDIPPGSDPRRQFSVGQDIEVVLLRRDPSGKMRFSARAVNDVHEKKAFAAFRKGGRSESLGSLGDLLKNVDLDASHARPAKK
jgi:small subunit ribosomal protein S1